VIFDRDQSLTPPSPLNSFFPTPLTPTSTAPPLRIHLCVERVGPIQDCLDCCILDGFGRLCNAQGSHFFLRHRFPPFPDPLLGGYCIYFRLFPLNTGWGISSSRFSWVEFLGCRRPPVSHFFCGTRQVGVFNGTALRPHIVHGRSDHLDGRPHFLPCQSALLASFATNAPFDPSQAPCSPCFSQYDGLAPILALV